MNIKSPEDIAEIVKEARKSQGLTQAKLAKLCGVGLRFISDLENAKSTCQIDKILKVLTGLGIKINMSLPATE
ncbi:MAG TPA: transcriptional regulator [Cyanobacteria bacterium UBA9971]|nr:transcriptional regulator [Cyanobacteria bacterium UBA9971]